MLKKLFKVKEKESCEFLLLQKTSTIEKLMFVYVEAKLSKDNTKCMITMIDISERKKLEIELNKTIKLLQEQNLG